MTEAKVFSQSHFYPHMEKIIELTGGKIKKAIVNKGYNIKGGKTSIDIVMPNVL
jgi:hypothetical protein